MAAISSLTTRSGKLRALSRAAIRMLGHDVDGEPTRIGDSLRTVCYIGAEDGGQTHGSDNGSARPGRARVAPADELSQRWLIAGVRDGSRQKACRMRTQPTGFLNGFVHALQHAGGGSEPHLVPPSRAFVADQRGYPSLSPRGRFDVSGRTV